MMIENQNRDLGDLGTWSHPPIEKPVEQVKNKQRRLVLQFLGAMAVETGLAFILRQAVDNAKYEREFSEQIYLNRIEEAARFPEADLVIYPDFESSIPPTDMWDRVDALKEKIGRISVGMFCTLQQIDRPETMERIRHQVGMIQHRGGKLVLSLGADTSELKGHPFDPENEDQMEEWMNKWVVFLRALHIPIDIRFLFEMNVVGGAYVAYKADSRVGGMFHSERFKTLFSLFYDKIHSGDSLSPEITVSVCGTCDGSDLRAYVPRRFDGYGLDAFNFSEGKTLVAPVNTLIGLRQIDSNVISKLRQVDTIVEAQSQKTGTRIKKQLYELGSLQDQGWVENMASYVLSQGYTTVGLLDMNKAEISRPTEKDWRLTAGEVDMFVKLFLDVRDARHRRMVVAKLFQMIFGKK